MISSAGTDPGHSLTRWSGLSRNPDGPSFRGLSVLTQMAAAETKLCPGLDWDPSARGDIARCSKWKEAQQVSLWPHMQGDGMHSGRPKPASLVLGSQSSVSLMGTYSSVQGVWVTTWTSAVYCVC